MSMFAQKSIQIIATGLIALSLSASAVAADKTLYERLGGKPALQAVVGELWTVVAADVAAGQLPQYFLYHGQSAQTGIENSDHNRKQNSKTYP